jgi:hypothetical protein
MMRRHDTEVSVREPRRKRSIFRRTGDVCAFPEASAHSGQKRGVQAWKGNFFRPYTTRQAFILPVLTARIHHSSLT